MTRFLSARAFTLFFGIGYALTIYFNWPLFRYYPLINRFTLADLPGREQGPAMSWYGWIATAAIIGAVAALVIPKRFADRIWVGVFWLVPLIMLAAGFYREQEWFLR